MRRLLPLLILFVLGAAPALDGDGGPAASAPRPEYLALGDSLAASMQPNATGRDQATSDGYAELVWRAHSRSTPGLELVKLGRGGETATSMLAPAKTRPSQLALAEQQLRSGMVRFVTIDIGANEVERCADATGFDSACVGQGLAALRSALPTIIARLRAAGGPSVPIVGINYYNSFLGRWVTGPPGRRLALASVPVERAINATADAAYRRAHVAVADVESRFQTRSLHRYVRTRAFGRVPLAVALTCRWTWACAARYDDHTNSAGYRVIAQAVLAALPDARR